jgi:invasion protein IalB
MNDRTWGMALALCLILAGGLSAPAFAGNTATAEKTAAAVQPRDYDDWRLSCASADEKSAPSCTIFQLLSVEQQNGKDKQQVPALTTVVHIEQVKDKPQTMIRMVTPLGIALISGISFKIDEGKPTQVPFMRCIPGGCLTEMIFDKEMLGKLKSAKKLLVGYKAQTGKDQVFDVSLKGFPQALEALEAADKRKG